MVSFATARVNARQRTIAQAACGVLGVVTLAALPFARVPLAVFSAFIPMFGAAFLVGSLLIAYLLMGQFFASRWMPLALLSGAFLFLGCMVVPGMFAYPAIVGSGGAGTAAIRLTTWCWIFWHAGFAIWLSAYAWADVRAVRRLSPAGARMVFGIVVAAACGSAAAFGFVAIHGNGALPPVFADGSYAIGFQSGVFAVLLALAVGSLALVALLTRAKTIVHLWVLVAMAATCCDLILILNSGARFSVGWYFARVELLAIGALLVTSFLGHVNAMSADLAALATIDGLTGVGNRRLYDDHLEAAYRNAVRHGESLGLILLDVDHFKEFNDAYGHIAGDDALRALAGVMKESLGRSIDVVARFGGEEFAVLLPESDVPGALVVAERMRAGIEALGIAHPSTIAGGRLTVSLGVTALGEGESPAEFAMRADAALYRAKALGRNRVVVFEAPLRRAVRAVRAV